MRVEFVEIEHNVNPDKDGFEICLPLAYPEAWQYCPWAGVIQPVNGGFICFESTEDWSTWKGGES